MKGNGGAIAWLRYAGHCSITGIVDLYEHDFAVAGKVIDGFRAPLRELRRHGE